MRLSKTDLVVIRAFTEQRPMQGNKLTTDGTRIDGMWMGGNGIASWKNGKIAFADLGSRAAQSVQKLIKKEAIPNTLPDSQRPKQRSKGSRGEAGGALLSAAAGDWGGVTRAVTSIYMGRHVK